MMLEAAAQDPSYRGHVTNTASMAGLLTPPNMGIYNAAKAAVVSLTETMYQDLRLVTDQIGASLLCPYFVPTGIAASERNRPGAAAEKPTRSQLIGKAMSEKAVSSGKVTAAEVLRLKNNTKVKTLSGKSFTVKNKHGVQVDKATVVKTDVLATNGVVHVIDTGPGIPQERLAEIFRPYVSMRSGGTGLGLPTARRIVQEHGGQLSVHTDPGRGSDFVIRLALDQSIERRDEKPAGASGAAVGPGRTQEAVQPP